MHQRKSRHGFSVLTLAILLAISVLMPVKADEAHDLYDAGIQAFEQEDYRQALELFRRAQSLGMDEPRLHYNLGVSHYRLDALDEAEAEFRQAAQAPTLAALSYYNLGLIALRRADTTAAGSWFRQALDDSDNPRLRNLALQMLERLDQPSAAEPAPSWLTFVHAAVGHDSNVLLISDDNILSSSENGDAFFEIFAHAGRALGRGSTSRTLEGNASLWLLRHMELSAYDMSMARAGINLGHAGKEWDFITGAHAAFTLLDAEPFTVESTLDLHANRGLPGGQLRLNYELGRIDSPDDLYAYLEGWRHRINGRLLWRDDAARLQLHYQYEYNDREDLEGARFTSFSPTRNTVRLAAEVPVSARIEFHAELQVSRSRYRDPHQIDETTRVRRIDDRMVALLRAARPLADGGELSLEYRYTDNQSSLAIYEYRRHRWMLGLHLPF